MIDFARKLASTLDRNAADVIREALAGAGIAIGGDAPWDIQVHDTRTYERIMRDGTVGVGESFTEGWWDCERLDQMIDRAVRGNLYGVLGKSWTMRAQVVRSRLLNLQAARPFEVGVRHYDVGNDLYREMLGPRMMYTCAYFKDTDSLDAAQEAKLDLVCRKIGLQSGMAGMRVLDLGCGWAGFASFAAERYGASVVGYTVSR